MKADVADVIDFQESDLYFKDLTHFIVPLILTKKGKSYILFL